MEKSLKVSSESLRTITITNIEERNIQNRLSKSKYTVYTISCDPPIISGVQDAVCRRYNDFKWFRKVLVESFPAIIPPIPPQKMMGRFKKRFT